MTARWRSQRSAPACCNRLGRAGSGRRAVCHHPDLQHRRSHRPGAVCRSLSGITLQSRTRRVVECAGAAAGARECRPQLVGPGEVDHADVDASFPECRRLLMLAYSGDDPSRGQVMKRPFDHGPSGSAAGSGHDDQGSCPDDNDPVRRPGQGTNRRGKVHFPHTLADIHRAKASPLPLEPRPGPAIARPVDGSAPRGGRRCRAGRAAGAAGRRRAGNRRRTCGSRERRRHRRRETTIP